MARRGFIQSATNFPRNGSFPRMNKSSRALVWSQAGPGGGVALSTCPTCRLAWLEPQVFRVLLLCRLQLPLPLTVRNCQFGHFLDVFASPGKRRFALEGRVTTNVLVRNLDLEVDARMHDGGAQLAMDDTIVSTLHGDGTAISGFDSSEVSQGKAIPELVSPRARATGGSWD